MRLPYGWTKQKTKIHKYQVYSYWWVTIEETEDTYEAWLSNESYGIQMFLFGALSKDFTLGEIIETIDRNIESYWTAYKKQFFDDWAKEEDE